MLPWICCGILIFIIVILWVKLFFLHRNLDEIGAQFEERMQQDTNNLIYLSAGDRHAGKLAAKINVQLRLLRKQRQQYLQGDQELKEAVTNISHDLRTPLTAIYGYLELLEREEKTEAVAGYLEQIQNRTEALKQLTEELFRYSVITSAQEDDRQKTEGNRVLEESLLSCYGAFLGRQIEPEISMPETPVFYWLDPSMLGRIFDNILNNALKYSDGDLAVTLLQDGTVTFSNASKNLTPVMTERLFDRFYTVETGRNSTGLGLSIAKRLTQRMGGEINARYQKERLIITLRFPLYEEGCSIAPGSAKG